MKKADSSSLDSSPSTPIPNNPTPVSSSSDIGDPLDDLLGDFNSASEEDSSDDSSEEESSNIRMVSGDDGGLSTDFGAQRSSHSNRRKVRKVRKVKRPRNP